MATVAVPTLASSARRSTIALLTLKGGGTRRTLDCASIRSACDFTKAKEFHHGDTEYAESEMI